MKDPRENVLVLPHEEGERGATITTVRCHRCAKNSRVGEVWSHGEFGYVLETIRRYSRRRQTARLWGADVGSPAVSGLPDWVDERCVARLGGINLIATCSRQGHRVGIVAEALAAAASARARNYVTVDVAILSDAPIAVLVDDGA